MNEVPNLVEFLKMIAGGGFVGVIVAFLLEKIPAFQALKSEVKKWVVMAMFIVLPVASTALLENVPPEIWALLEPYWGSLALGFVSWVGSQIAHGWDKRIKTC